MDDKKVSAEDKSEVKTKVEEKVTTAPVAAGNNTLKIVIITVLVLVVLCCLCGLGVYLFAKDEVMKQIDALATPNTAMQGEPVPTNSSTSAATPNTGWKTVSHNGTYYKFSISIPKDSSYCFTDSAPAGAEGVCDDNGGVGVRVNNKKYPMGFVLDYTTLDTQTEALAAYADMLPNKIETPVNYGGTGKAYMSTGKETQYIFESTELGDESTEVEVYFTRYFFSNGKEHYLVSLNTDSAKADLPTLEAIMQSWKFLK